MLRTEEIDLEKGSRMLEQKGEPACLSEYSLQKDGCVFFVMWSFVSDSNSVSCT